eukprot:scaffold12782_cov168-Amphora_coffeaeformis.AAC.8
MKEWSPVSSFVHFNGDMCEVWHVEASGSKKDCKPGMDDDASHEASRSRFFSLFMDRILLHSTNQQKEKRGSMWQRRKRSGDAMLSFYLKTTKC